MRVRKVAEGALINIHTNEGAWISCGVCSLNICNDVTRASLDKIG